MKIKEQHYRKIMR